MGKRRLYSKLRKVLPLETERRLVMLIRMELRIIVIRKPDRVQAGPEFLSVVDGMTGKELARTDYIPRGDKEDWNDYWGMLMETVRIVS